MCPLRQPVVGQVMAALFSGCRRTGAAAELKQAKEAGIKKKDENIFEKVKISRKLSVNFMEFVGEILSIIEISLPGPLKDSLPLGLPCPYRPGEKIEGEMVK